MMKLLARRGDEMFLIGDEKQGVIVDLEGGTREKTGVPNIASAMRLGYWEPVEDDDALREYLLDESEQPEKESPTEEA